MALIGADVHANGKQASPIPRFGSPSGFVGSYGRGGDTVQLWPGPGPRGGTTRTPRLPKNRSAPWEGGPVAPAEASPEVPVAAAPESRLLLRQRPQPAQRAVLGHPNGAR